MSRFEVDTNDYLGFKYEAYRNEMYAIALATPSDYFKIRKEVLGKVKNEAIKDIYTSFYKILSLGEDQGSNKIIKPATGAPLIPGFPQQEVSKIALKAARTLDALLDEVINIILPADYKKLATSRLEETSKDL